jgi:hypothetical protein
MDSLFWRKTSIGRDISYLVKHRSDSAKTFSETDIFSMLVFLIDNIFAMFGGRVFQQTIGIWVPTVLVFSLTCSFIRMRQISYKGFSRKTKRGYPSRSFNFTFRHVDDILSLNNSRFGDFVDHIYIFNRYPKLTKFGFGA